MHTRDYWGMDLRTWILLRRKENRCTYLSHGNGVQLHILSFNTRSPFAKLRMLCYQFQQYVIVHVQLPLNITPLPWKKPTAELLSLIERAILNLNNELLIRFHTTAKVQSFSKYSDKYCKWAQLLSRDNIHLEVRHQMISFRDMDPTNSKAVGLYHMVFNSIFRNWYTRVSIYEVSLASIH